MIAICLLTVLACIAVVSCTTVDTHDNKLPTRSAFTSKHNASLPIPTGASFGWAEDQIHVYADERLPIKDIAKILKDSIVDELTRRGLRPVMGNAEPDYLVAYVAALKHDLDDSTIQLKYGIQPGLFENQVNPDKFEKGTIIVDLIDNKKHSLYWRGAGQAFANLEQAPLEQRSQRINHFIKLLMNDLPKTSDKR